MALPRFFLENQVLARETERVFPLQLADDDIKHARVLRLAPGEHIAVIDADRDYFECEIEAWGPEGMTVSIAAHPDHAPSGAQITLAQGLAKGDKMDTVFRHATEVGVSRFIPLACDRSIVKLDAKKEASRQKRWQTIVKSAAMQAGREMIPPIEPVQSVAQVIQSLHDHAAVIVFWEEAPVETTVATALDELLQRTPDQITDLILVVGPEGGLTESEVNAFLSSACPAVAASMGPYILRTETAGLVAPALVAYELQRKGSQSPASNPAGA